MNELVKALALAQAEMRNPVCDKVNSGFNSRYATLSAILDAVRPALNRHGIAVVQLITSAAAGSITVTTVLLHGSGERLEASVTVGIDANIQRTASAITYLRRYSLASMVGVVGDEDDDAEAVESHKRKDSKPKPEAKPKPPVVPNADQLVVVQIDAKTGKKGNPFWLVRFVDSAGKTIEASTFSETIKGRLEASGGVPVSAFLEKREGPDGKKWLNIIDVI